MYRDRHFLGSGGVTTVTRTGEPSPVRRGPVASSRRRGGGRKGAPAAQPDVCPALPDLYHAQDRSLFRSAVLLMGDAVAAVPWYRDSFAASYRLRKRPQRRTTPCRTCGDCW